jgi:hypothetical protein
MRPSQLNKLSYQNNFLDYYRYLHQIHRKDQAKPPDTGAGGYSRKTGKRLETADRRSSYLKRSRRTLLRGLCCSIVYTQTSDPISS